jgi:hypothetical protein
MKLTRIARYTVLGLTVAWGLAAWPADPRTSAPAPTAINSFQIYVGFFNAQQVNIYKQGRNGPVSALLDGLGNITGGIAVDKQQNVYVTTGGGWVVTYPPAGLVPSQRYQFRDQHQPPLTAGITVDQAGTLYAALFNDRGIVAEYAAGNPNQATFTLAPPPPNAALAVAVDRQNNLYVEYSVAIPFPQPAYIEKCLPQSDQCTDLGVRLGAGGFNLAVDSQGNVVACDELAGEIDVFPPGGGQPRVISQGLAGCGFFALDSTETYLVVGNEGFNGGATSISIFNYATGDLLENITAGVPQDDFISGLALGVSPKAVP